MERNLLCSIVSNIPLPKGVQISEDALYYDTHTHTHTHADSSSSYGNDDSEDSDWAPPDEDNEDVRMLMADAESFISNKKMRKPV